MDKKVAAVVVLLALLVTAAPAYAAGEVVARVNFQTATATTPAGWAADSGRPFDAGRGYGWVAPGTSTPRDLSANTRRRSSPSDPLLQTFVIMQDTAIRPSGVNGDWEYALGNGTYDVTVSVGDAAYFDSSHTLTVEGVPAISGFRPTSSNPFKRATVTATVSDGRLTLAAVPPASNNTKVNFVQIVRSGPAAPDETAPTVAVTVDGPRNAAGDYQGQATVTVSAADQGGSGLASVAYALDGGAFQPYTGPVTVTAPGDHTVVARAADGAGTTTTSPTTAFRIVTAPASGGRVAVENADGVPFADRLVFSRIQSPESGTRKRRDGSCCVPRNGVHDRVVLRVRNAGSGPLRVTGLAIDKPADFRLDAAVALPATVAPGAALDVPVRFVATAGDMRTATLSVTTDDPTRPRVGVQLAGFWQRVSEGGEEPSVVELVRTFGYTTRILNSGQGINNDGRITTVGEEVLAPYWRRASTARPVTVRQLGAYHSQGSTATFYWHARGSSSTSRVFTMAGVDAQTVLPRRDGDLSRPASGSFTPSDAVFGLKIDGEWSDPARNDRSRDNCGSPRDLTTCGHHVRAWPVRDRAGTIVANTYLVVMDYSGINYDFNDNVYLVANVVPEAG